MDETDPALAAALAAAVGEGRVRTRAIDRVAWASDASFYRLVPQAVVHASSADEVRRLFAVSRAHGVPLVFRSAGTSLSGQSVTDGVLVETARGFRGLAVEDGGARIRVQPGVIGAHANRALRPFGRKIGPDPASIATCTLGGILANNASGMCCGVAQNAYHTLESLTFLLPSGTAIDTARPDADDVLRAKEPALWRGLAELRARVLADAALAARIRAKYRTKNTTGYSLNAFLDYERPVDVFARLLVGSEGTLAFIAEAVLRTVPDLPVKVTGLLLFPDLHAACARDRPAQRGRREGARGHGPRGPALGRGRARRSRVACARSRPAPRASSRSSRPRARTSARSSPERRSPPRRPRRASRSSSRPASRTTPRSRRASGASARGCSRPSAP